MAILAALAAHLRQLTLLAGFLAALRGARGASRAAMFTVFARHLTGGRRGPQM
ncbi:hypothetical protein [Kitasatospora sp. NPDC088346]|uniref:hypothetical protein n=1 Tax=Kitasatospora sp. NPDC088346 TaxID=3364073 RepID=UPI00381D0747